MIMTVWAMLLVEWVHPCVRDMYDQGFFRECGDQCLRSTQSAPSFMDLFRALFQRNRWFWYVFVMVVAPFQAFFIHEMPSNASLFEVLDANLLLFKTVIAGDSWGEIAVPVIQEFPATSSLAS